MGTKRIRLELRDDGSYTSTVQMVPYSPAKTARKRERSVAQTELHPDLKRLHMQGKEVLNELLTQQMRIESVPSNGNCVPIAAGVDKEEVVAWRKSAAELVRNGPNSHLMQTVMRDETARLKLADDLARVDLKKGGAFLSTDAIPIFANELKKNIALIQYFDMPDNGFWTADFAWKGVWEPLGHQTPPQDSNMTSGMLQLESQEDMLKVLQEFHVILFDYKKQHCHILKEGSQPVD